MNLRHPFSIKKYFYEKMDLRLHYLFHVTICEEIERWLYYNQPIRNQFGEMKNQQYSFLMFLRR